MLVKKAILLEDELPPTRMWFNPCTRRYILCSDAKVEKEKQRSEEREILLGHCEEWYVRGMLWRRLLRACGGRSGAGGVLRQR